MTTDQSVLADDQSTKHADFRTKTAVLKPGPQPRGRPAAVRPPDPNVYQWPSLFWRFRDFRGHGVMDLGINCEGEVNDESQVMASLTELHADTPLPMLAPASMEVWNVTPRSNGLVQLRVNIQWGSPIPFRVNLIILN